MNYQLNECLFFNSKLPQLDIGINEESIESILSCLVFISASRVYRWYIVHTILVLNKDVYKSRTFKVKQFHRPLTIVLLLCAT